MGEILDKATDPTQYDKSDTGWPYMGVGLDSPISQIYWEYLSPYTVSWEGKDLLDIGSGTGWLLDLALKAGAKLAVGVEPAKRNIELAKEHFPHTTVIQSTIEDFKPEQEFDVALAIMSLVHVKDIDLAFRRISELLKPGGELQAIVGDYDYFKRPRYDYEVLFEDISNDEYVTVVKRPDFGTLADVIRRVSRYEQAGNQSDLRLVENKLLPPTEAYMKRFSRYRQVEGVTMWNLLRFNKI